MSAQGQREINSTRIKCAANFLESWCEMSCDGAELKVPDGFVLVSPEVADVLNELAELVEPSDEESS